MTLLRIVIPLHQEAKKRSPRARYWTMHWLRVVLWPLPVLTIVRAGRATRNRMRHP